MGFISVILSTSLLVRFCYCWTLGITYFESAPTCLCVVYNMELLFCFKVWEEGKFKHIMLQFDDVWLLKWKFPNIFKLQELLQAHIATGNDIQEFRKAIPLNKLFHNIYLVYAQIVEWINSIVDPRCGWMKFK